MSHVYIFYFERVEIHSNTVLEIDFFGPCLSPLSNTFLLFMYMFFLSYNTN